MYIVERDVAFGRNDKMRGKIQAWLKLTAAMQQLDGLNDTLTAQIALVDCDELAEADLELISAADGACHPLPQKE